MVTEDHCDASVGESRFSVLPQALKTSVTFLKIRRFWLVVLFILAMGSTSCRTIKQQPRRVLIPGKEILGSTPEIDVEQYKLAETLSLDLKMEIEPREDNLLLYAFMCHC